MGYIWVLYGLYMGYIMYIYIYGIFPLIYGIYMEYPEFFFMDYPHWMGFHGDKNGDVSWENFAKNGDALKR